MGGALGHRPTAARAVDVMELRPFHERLASGGGGGAGAAARSRHGLHQPRAAAVEFSRLTGAAAQRAQSSAMNRSRVGRRRLPRRLTIQRSSSEKIARAFFGNSGGTFCRQLVQTGIQSLCSELVQLLGPAAADRCPVSDPPPYPSSKGWFRVSLSAAEAREAHGGLGKPSVSAECRWRCRMASGRSAVGGSGRRLVLRLRSRSASPSALP